MYHPASIAPLSASQISKALKGLPVRVSVGNQHDVELSAQQFKNLAKAHKKGKASTITMDPFQIQNHMHLLGAGKLKKTVRGNAGRLITSATDRAIRAIQGGNITAVAKDSGKDVIVASGERAVRSIEGSGMRRRSRGGNITAVAKDSGKDVIVASGERAVRSIAGSGIGDFNNSVHSGMEKVMTGSSVNRLKKGQRWEQFANATIRDGIDTAGKAARVYYDSTGPMAQMGFGLKKRGRPRKSGGALYPAGVY